MKKLLPLLAFVPLSFAAQADCSYPRAPDRMPNGASASLDEMKVAKTAVEKYNKDMEAYLSCIKLEADDQLAKQGSTLSEDQKKQLAVMYAQKNDAAVDELQAVAARFNEQVRAYKAKPAAK